MRPQWKSSLRRRPSLAAAFGAALVSGAILAPTATADVVATDTDGASDIVLVKVDRSAPNAEKVAVRTRLGVEPREVELLPDGWRAYHLDAPMTARQVRSRVGAEAAERVEINLELMAYEVPNDPNWSALWGLRNIRAAEAWDISQAASDVVVAVADTGVQTTHPDLAGAIWTNSDEVPGNGIDDDGNGYVDDVNGWDFRSNDSTLYDGASDTHGTHVAGTIAGVRNNSTGVVGVAPNVKIMPLKFIGPSTGSTYHAIQAMQYAVANGATAINASWGGPYSEAVCAAVESASEAGVVVISAAGNGGSDQIGDDIDTARLSPASCLAPGNITVAAIESDNSLARYSNFGDQTVDVAAPGSGILSTVPGGYESQSGTSMAAPHVAGAVALLRGLDGKLTPAQVERRIRETATATPALKGLSASAARLDLLSLVQSVSTIPVPPGAPAPVAPALGSLLPSRSVSFDWEHPEQYADSVTGYELVIDGAVVLRTGPTVTSATISLTDGRHSWEVRALGAAVPQGRVAGATSFTVDTTAPTAFAVVGPTTTTAARPTIRWQAHDASSAIAGYEVRVNGSLVAQGSSSLTTYRLQSLSLGKHAVRVTAFDLAGNERVATTTLARVRAAASPSALGRISVRARPGTVRTSRGRLLVPVVRAKKARTVVATISVRRNGRLVRLRATRARVGPRARFLVVRAPARVLRAKGTLVIRWRGTTRAERRWSGKSVSGKVRARALRTQLALARRR